MKTNSPVLEIASFRLKPGVSEAQWRAAFDACTRFLLRCRGFRGRRLTREPATETWIELCQWSSDETARAAGEAFWTDADTAGYRECIDSTAETLCRHVIDFARAPGAGGAPGFHANIVTAKFDDTWDFYSRLLGFSTAVETDGYVHLVHPSGAELGILRHELNGDWPQLVSATDGRGWWLSLNVADADAEHERLLAAGADIVQPPRDQPWGERSCVLRDPNGVLVFVAHQLAETRTSELATLG